MSRNPYRLAEKIASWTIGILIATLVIFAIGAVAARGWGWWALLLLIAVPLGAFVLGLVAGLIQHVCWNIERAWERRKFQWDRERADRG